MTPPRHLATAIAGSRTRARTSGDPVDGSSVVWWSSPTLAATAGSPDVLWQLAVRRRSAGRYGRVEQTEPFVFSADETCDIGFEAGSPVTDDYTTPDGRFNGEVNWVEIDIGEAADDTDHFVSAKERYRVVMAIQ